MRSQIDKSHKGATLTEYGFIGAIILVAGIVAVMMLGVGVNSIMVALQGDMGAHTASAQTSEQLRSANGAVGGASETIIGDTTGQHCLADGRCYDGGGHQSGATTQTNGGMGTRVATLSGLLINLNLTISITEDVDPVTAERITALANQGHDASAIAAGLDAACAQGPAQCNQAMNQLLAEISQFNAMNQDLENYFQANPHALTATIQQEIANEVNRINAIAQALELAMTVAQAVGTDSQTQSEIIEEAASNASGGGNHGGRNGRRGAQHGGSSSQDVGGAVGSSQEASNGITESSNNICGDGGNEAECTR